LVVLLYFAHGLSHGGSSAEQSWLEPRKDPAAICLQFGFNPIMQTTTPPLPELDAIGDQPESPPMGRTRNWLGVITVFGLMEQCNSSDSEGVVLEEEEEGWWEGER